MCTGSNLQRNSTIMFPLPQGHLLKTQAFSLSLLRTEKVDVHHSWVEVIRFVWNAFNSDI